MRNALVILFFICAMAAVFVGGYLSGDRHPSQIVNNYKVIVTPDGVTTSRIGPRKKPAPMPTEVQSDNTLPSELDLSVPKARGEKTNSAPPVAESKREIEPVPPPTTELGPLEITFPKPMYVGKPPPMIGNPRIVTGGSVTVGPGTRLLSRGMPVTSSDTNPLLGELSQITDGDKSAEEGSYVELASGLQWIQIDLQAVHAIGAIAFWHYHLQARAYHDVIVLISNDPEFKTGVLPVTRDIYTGSYVSGAYVAANGESKVGAMLFNNDKDGTAKWSAGTDDEYIESNRGRLISGWGLPARYVRLYSNGNTANGANHYVEVEVYGK